MSWSTIPIRALYRRVEESRREDLPLLSVYRDHGVVPREGRDDNFNKASEDLSRYKVVKPGDLVLNKMKTWQGSLGVASHEGIVSPAYFVGRRIGDVDDRFMHHLLRSQPLIAEYGARSKGIRPSQWDLPWEEFAAIKVHIPGNTEQRAIADCLDAETAHIDALVAARRRQGALISSRWRAIVTRDYISSINEWGAVKVVRLIHSMEQGWSPQCEDRPAEVGEFGVLKSGCVNGGRFSADQHKALPDGVEVRLQHLVQPGDFLVSRASGSLDLIGSAAVVPKAAPRNLLLCDKLYRLRFTGYNANFAALMFQAQPIREAIRLGTSGAEGMANNVPSGVIRALSMPAAPVREQERISADLLKLEYDSRLLSAALVAC